MSSDAAPDVSALAINVTIPEGLRWTDTGHTEDHRRHGVREAAEVVELRRP